MRPQETGVINKRFTMTQAAHHQNEHGFVEVVHPRGCKRVPQSNICITKRVQLFEVETENAKFWVGLTPGQVAALARMPDGLVPGANVPGQKWKARLSQLGVLPVWRYQLEAQHDGKPQLEPVQQLPLFADAVKNLRPMNLPKGRSSYLSH